MMRRRAVVGTVAVGGAAYYAGKKGAEAGEREPDQEARLEEPEAQEAPAPEEADYIDELGKLAELHEQGILSDEEFETKKKDLLGI